MSSEPSPRQSRGKERKSYRLEDEYAFLDEDEDGSAPSGTQTPVFRDDDDDDGDDFMPDAQAEEPEEDLEDDVAEEDEEDGTDEEEDDSYSEEDSIGPRKRAAGGLGALPVPSTPVTRHNLRPTDIITSPFIFAKRDEFRRRKVDTENKLRTRGIPDFDKIGGHETRLKNLFGPDNEHLKPVLSSRDYWFPQETFPIRSYAKTKPDDVDCGSLRRSFFESSDAREKENEASRSWYNTIGKSAFAQVQKIRRLDPNEEKACMSTSGLKTLNVLLGPTDNPHVYSLAEGSYMSVAEAFPNSSNRRAWLFNLGSRVQDAQWSINEDSSTQYLAVAVEQKPIGGRQPKPMEHPKAPGFTATEKYPASIQIWAFEATENGDLDTSTEPRLELVICTDWGAPKQLRWSPVAATDGTHQPDDEQSTHIGFLAGIWSDGRVRLLDVSAPMRGSDIAGPIYLHYSHAAFEISFPQTIPSCLQWLSGISLAVGTAAGTVGIWTLTRPGTLAEPEASNHNPRPWFYQQLADTYILTMSSGWPSQPQYLSINTADGFARLFDIRSPTADTTASIRGRTLCLTQAWHDHTQSFVMPDDHCMLKHTPIRRYYHNLYSMRLESSITRVATSPVHPGVLIGGTNGDVETTNPVGRIVNYKNIPWQQKWFVHEWRGPMDKMLVRPAEEENVEMVEGGPVEQAKDDFTATAQDGDAASLATEANKVPQAILSQPLVRITEGYKAIQPGIAQSATTKRSESSKRLDNSEIGRAIRIYEEQSAVTALAWNPNLKFGTWAVAGMGSGLLRVEDVSISVKR
ncbi:hypothetical protein BDW02DRAFT_596594 [Decorospora gaudefroyi]|uniref:WD40 repeat-like protein n=1 Tax=Decorospora gaudefroyi TaxID=184978 RepID=A0A6A5KJA8_9PLEO|nr:hypothetical protein BDW02DRAFT_596594 [Decorospora gaudefroyi]